MCQFQHIVICKYKKQMTENDIFKGKKSFDSE